MHPISDCICHFWLLYLSQARRRPKAPDWFQYSVGPSSPQVFVTSTSWLKAAFTNSGTHLCSETVWEKNVYCWTKTFHFVSLLNMYTATMHVRWFCAFFAESNKKRCRLLTDNKFIFHVHSWIDYLRISLVIVTTRIMSRGGCRVTTMVYLI